MNDELERLICGERIGFGAHREVFECRINPKYVVKKANDDYARAINLIEEKLWWDIVNTPIAKWFAPVIQSSMAGKYLMSQKNHFGTM